MPVLPNKRSKPPGVLECLGLIIKSDMKGRIKVGVADQRVQKINEMREMQSGTRPMKIMNVVNSQLSDLHRACRQDIAADVALLLAQEPQLIHSPSTSNEDSFGSGGTSLHFATIGNHAQMLQTLLSKGARPSSKSDRGITALHIACQRGLIECATVLMEHGASMTERDHFGQTPMAILRQDCGDIGLRRARAAIQTHYIKLRDKGSKLNSELLTLTDRMLNRQ